MDTESVNRGQEMKQSFLMRLVLSRAFDWFSVFSLFGLAFFCFIYPVYSFLNGVFDFKYKSYTIFVEWSSHPFLFILIFAWFYIGGVVLSFVSVSGLREMLRPKLNNNRRIFKK